MFTVKEIIQATGGKAVTSAKLKNIKAISIDSRTIKPGEAFVALRGKNFDGHNYIPQAIKKGASCIIKQKRLKHSHRHGGSGKTAVIEVDDTT
jgi:UDP-N-acetylmuramoyl-tripeptide--D-alanyl-D-alanine ligase